MTIAFEHRIVAPSGARSLAGLLMLGAAASAVLTTLQVHAGHGAATACLVAGLLAVAWAGGLLGRRRTSAPRLLQVDAAGRARLQIDGRPWACTPQRWLISDGWAALRVRVVPADSAPGGKGAARTLHLLIGPADQADAWRRLRVWLTWLERGELPDGSYDDASLRPAHGKSALGAPRG